MHANFLKWMEDTTGEEKNAESVKKEGRIFMKKDEEIKREVLDISCKKVIEGNDMKKGGNVNE